MGWAKLARESENIIMVYENQPVKKTDALFKFLKTKARTQEFNFLVGAKLEGWIDKEFQKYGAKIEFSARAKLIIFVGKDLWQMSQEIKKLSAYKLKGIVQAKDVKLLVVPKIETDIFKTIDAIAMKNKSSALLLLHKHLAKGDAPLYLLSMINFQFRNLLSVKDFMERRGNTYNSFRIPGMHPYVARKSSAQAQNFTFDKLKKIYYKLLAIDSEIKTGKVDARMALDMLVIGI
jgi:DNA polymerase-3 subunit delta